jgi:hypothetical protein
MTQEHQNNAVGEATGAARTTGAASARALARCGRWSLVLGFVCFPVPAFALLINMSFESIPGAVPMTGAGTHTATLNFGSVSAFEPLNPGVSRTVGASSYTVSTHFGVRATHLLSLLSPNYTLTGRLQSGSTITWQLDGVTMSTSAATIATSQPYGPTVSHTVAFAVPFSRPAGAISTVFEVTAIAN